MYPLLGFENEKYTQEAVEFFHRFTPSADPAKYDWLLDYPKDAYSALVDDFKDLDNKASTVISYIGSGTGILTIGAIFAAASSEKMDISILYSLLVPFVFAMLTLCLANHARQTREFPSPPSLDWATHYADSFPEPVAKVEILKQWNIAAAMLRVVVFRKERWVNRSVQALTVTVFSLVLPLVAAIVSKREQNRQHATPPAVTTPAALPAPAQIKQPEESPVPTSVPVPSNPKNP